MFNRRKLALHASNICLRLSPRQLGPSLILLCTFVATTISSRIAKSFNARPVISSLTPNEY